MNAYRIEIYARNEKRIYDLINSCANSIAKKIKRGITIDNNKLVSSSSVAKIVSEAAKIVLRYDGIKLTKDERNEGKKIIAREITDRAEEMIQYNEI